MKTDALLRGIVTEQPYRLVFATYPRRVRLWIHGHINHRSDYTIGKTRVLANPRGYPTKPREDFDPGLIVEV